MNNASGRKNGAKPVPKVAAGLSVCMFSVTGAASVSRHFGALLRVQDGTCAEPSFSLAGQLWRCRPASFGCRRRAALRHSDNWPPPAASCTRPLVELGAPRCRAGPPRPRRAATSLRRPPLSARVMKVRSLLFGSPSSLLQPGGAVAQPDQPGIGGRVDTVGAQQPLRPGQHVTGVRAPPGPGWSATGRAPGRRCAAACA